MIECFFNNQISIHSLCTKSLVSINIIIIS
ncbi:MAG: hypothetical protein AB1Z23_09565 [Eubacteriales bacterium]